MSAAAEWRDPPGDVLGVLDACEGVQRTGPEQWEARCPVPEHGSDGDGVASFAITVGTKQPVVVECLGGCDFASVVAALTEGGLDASLFGAPSLRTLRPSARRSRSRKQPPPHRETPKRPSPMSDQDKPLGWHDRLVDRAESDPGSPEAEELDFLTTQRGLAVETIERFKIGYDGERITVPVKVRGKWVNVRRYEPGAKQKKMLNLPDHGTVTWYPVDNLRGTTGPVLVCEGEFDALLAHQEGKGAYVAVTQTGGASTLPKDLSPLTDREVVIAYDADVAGIKGAAKLATALRGVARKVAVLDVTRLGLTPDSGDDITDYLVHGGGTGHKLAGAIAQALSGERERFRLVFASELAEPVPPMRWLVQGVWPEKSYGSLSGAKKTLKTYTGLALALSVATGEPFLGHFDVPAVGNVLYLLGEGGQRPTQRRLQRVAAAMETPLADVGQRLAMTYDVAPVDDPEFIETAKRLLDRVQPDLVVLDPLYAFHGRDVEAQNLYSRGQMLAELQALLGGEAALVVADHFNKTGSAALDLDSIAQSGVGQWADSWVLQRHREDPAVDAGEFRLAVEFGSRQWGGTRYAVDWSLGTFDPSTGEHDGDLAWQVAPLEWSDGDGKRPPTSEGKYEQRVLEAVLADPWALTKAEVRKAATGNNEAIDAAIKRLLAASKIRTDRVKGRGRDGREITREVLGPVGKLRLSAAPGDSAENLRQPDERAEEGG